MADRVKQPEAAKMKPENKSYYDLFGDVNPAVEAVKKKYEEPEVKEEKVSSTWSDRNLTDVFVEKYWNNLVGSKLSNAINEFSKDMGIQGSWKEDIAQSYIWVRKASLTPEQVKSQFSEDVKTKKIESVDYSPFLKEWYKKLESYGIKVPEASKTSKASTKKTETKSETKETESAKNEWEESVSSNWTDSNGVTDTFLPVDINQEVISKPRKEWQNWLAYFDKALIEEQTTNARKAYENEKDPSKKEQLKYEFEQIKDKYYGFLKNKEASTKKKQMAQIWYNIEYNRWQLNDLIKKKESYQSKWLTLNLSEIDKQINSKTEEIKKQLDEYNKIKKTIS